MRIYFDFFKKIIQQLSFENWLKTLVFYLIIPENEFHF